MQFAGRHNYSLFWGLILIGSIAALSLVAPLIGKHRPEAQINPAQQRYQSPSTEHWFGTDQYGRDVFARVWQGGRISLTIALLVVGVAVLFGSGYGALAGYRGGAIDRAMMRVVDMLLSFPVIFLAVTCVALFGTGLTELILVLAFTSWMDLARLVRAEVLSLKERPFILKARAAGLPAGRVIVRHLLPNVLLTLAAVVVIRVADIILIESALSFLGLGVSPPMASWGTIINDGRRVLTTCWWLSLFPGLAIAATTVGLNLIGDGLQRS